MKKIYLNLICAAFLVVLSANVMAQNVRYVKPGASGSGTSWNDAGDLQAMINASAINDEVWVAAGTYKPTEKLDVAGDNRDKTFILRAGVKIYGGFVGNNETSLSERNVTANVTILSGDLNNSNSANDGDAYHVVVSAGNSNGAVLDGFTIQHGFANVATELAGVARNQGAGINITNEATSVTFSNLIIKDNQSSGNSGGGAYLALSGTSNCTFENVVFDSNKVTSASGGAMYFVSVSGSPKVTVKNSKVFRSGGNSGAGFYVLGSDENIPQLNIFNTIFSENRASNTPGGGAIYLAGYTKSTIVNCTFYNNSNTNGALSFNGANTTLNLYNSIFNKNTKSSSNQTSADIRNITGAVLDLRSNLFQVTPPDGFESTEFKNIIDETPANLFSSTDISSANFLQLVEGAATEKGDNSYITTYGLTTDLAGNPRKTHTNVDLGAYEYQGTLPVELLSFSVKKTGNGAELNWIVASESNNEKFVIERSNNRQDFNPIATVQSKGNTTQSVSYSCVDSTPLNGDNYYRLLQRDKDGTSEVLGIRVIKFDLSAAGIQVYPNPAKDVLKIKMGTIRSDIARVRLISLEGNALLTKQITKTNAEQGFDLDVRAVNAGTYILLIESADKTHDKTKVVIVK
ncbi:T9SS type A sorting domain-containing protein [Pedobacter sp. BS3]|uniref:T9SS type A sorting domain-containing protein n=1 Tax=Pedobacter sp. BS3 TaxID=2567937 RepID=UPI0011EBF999|nr:T9SS type A sorting domain-containing protein [Pedobacter sp. BS3]TZF84910.1 T9SS type A sorting domain-containing protein [Pedobacter sp. BS3]